MARKRNPVCQHIFNELYGDVVESLIDQIDFSPYQTRRYFDEALLRELARDIEQNGLLNPIIVRLKSNGRYELISGERRFRAIRDYTTLGKINVKIVTASDLEARTMAASENLQRENLSPIETLQTLVELMDAELLHQLPGQSPTDYAALGDTPLQRVEAFLKQLSNFQRQKRRGVTLPDDAEKKAYHRVGILEEICSHLPKPLNWNTFFLKDLPILLKTSQEVLGVATRFHLSKSKTLALNELHGVSTPEFEKLVDATEKSLALENQGLAEQRYHNLQQMSATEIKALATRLQQTVAAPPRPVTVSKEFAAHYWQRLGYSNAQITENLDQSRTNVETWLESNAWMQALRDHWAAGKSVETSAELCGCPEVLAWSLFFEDHSAPEVWDGLGWHRKASDVWRYSTEDPRFGNHADTPDSQETRSVATMPPQWVGNLLHYFTKPGELVANPLGQEAMVRDVCLVMNRRCLGQTQAWSDPVDQWTTPGNEKPDLILWRPPAWKELPSQDESPSDAWTAYVEKIQTWMTRLLEKAKTGTRLACLGADQMPPDEAPPGTAPLLMTDWWTLLHTTGWRLQRVIDCPLPSPQPSAEQSQRWESRQLISVRRSLFIAEK